MVFQKTRTLEIEKYLRDNCADKTVKELAKSIKRERRTVATWLKELGLVAKKYRKIKLNKDQINFLWENWFEPLPLLEKGLGIKYVLGHLEDLGIERPNDKHQQEKIRALMYRLRNFSYAEPSWWNLPATRKEAIELKQKYFWNGQPCLKSKHISKRITGNGSCYYCEKEQRKNEEDFLQKEKEILEKILKLRKEEKLTYKQISKSMNIGLRKISSIIKNNSPELAKPILLITSKQHQEELNKKNINYTLKGKYNGRRKHSSYYCRKHNNTEKASAGHILNGQRLKCCQKENRGKKRIANHAATYDSELAQYGIVVRRDNYVGTHKRIWHFCLIHKKFYKGTPSHLKKGGGLACCRDESTKSISDRQNEEARKRFRKSLARVNPHYEWVGLPYINTKSKIMIYCKKHKQKHPIAAGKVLQRRQIPCCTYEGRSLCGKKMAELNRTLPDYVWRALLGKLEANGGTYLYLYESPEEGYSKFGISNNPQKRSTQGGYGRKLIEPKFYIERADCVLIEQAYKYGYSCEPPESLREWQGHTELTTRSPEEFLEIIDDLEKALLDLGHWEFAKEYCDPQEIRKALDEKK